MGPSLSFLLAAGSFGAALLLFCLQPMAGRALLPALGGTPAVWATCLAFFQTALFLGYLWAHLGSRWLSRRAHVLAHGTLVILAAAALFAWPLGHLAAPPGPRAWPQLWVLGWLAGRVGLPFVVLAATAPLLQRWSSWLAHEHPYRLYALSNAGSLLALALYPLWIEPRFDLTRQAAIWSFGFGLVMAAIGGVCVRVWRVFPGIGGAPAPASVSWRRRLLWLGLSGASSLLLVAVTAHITIDVASGPLLWVAPLMVYLLSFIWVFGRMGESGRGVFAAAWVVCCLLLSMNLFLAGQTGIVRQLVVALASLLFGSLLCHGELVRLRPGAEGLTGFYLWMAGGGALGGVLGGLVAPHVFSGLFELQVAVLSIFALLLVSGRVHGATDVSLARRPVPRSLFLGIGLAVPLMLATIWVNSLESFRGARVVARARGFFGLLQVTQFEDARVLTHGRIRHGMQWSDPARAREPTMYFARHTAVGRVLEAHRAGHARHVVVLGLGAGTLATYARTHDRFDFLEIDPLVVAAAEEHFTFLRDAAADVRVRVGDGRDLLRAYPDASVDTIVLDAFSSDAVPTHLLTWEAFRSYQRVLRPAGLIVANVSNRHLAVERVVAGALEALNWRYEVHESPTDRLRGSTEVRWVVAAPDGASLSALSLGDPDALLGPPHLWRDAHGSVLAILKPRARSRTARPR